MKNRGPVTTRRRVEAEHRLRRRSVAFAVAAALAVPEHLLAQALPTGGQVVGGSSQATISQPSASTLRVDQYVPRTAIDWQTFSIGAGNSVVFNQPSSSAVALNRVLGNNVSEIFGRLT